MMIRDFFLSVMSGDLGGLAARDGGLEVGAEVFQRALQRLDRARRVRAERATGAEQAAVLGEDLEVAGLAAAFLERDEQLLEPRQAVAARRAEAARFLREEM